MSKLTLADCFKYPNAVIKITDDSSIGCSYYDNIFEMIYKRGDFDSRINTVTLKDVFEDYTLSQYKLILRPLESLTEEEEYELSLYDDYPDIINDTGLKVATGDVKFIDKLREWNIDIDGMERDGKAVYDV